MALFPVRVTALLAPVLRLIGPAKETMPPALFCTRCPSRTGALVDRPAEGDSGCRSGHALNFHGVVGVALIDGVVHSHAGCAAVDGNGRAGGTGDRAGGAAPSGLHRWTDW